MAMLAEPRRKQKWSVDPRNSTWSKDESKFGQKMLEKMGWSKGKGLGAQEQGSTEHIKVQVKNNTLGLGASNKYEDNWIAHQDDFNQLLAELNDCHGAGSAASSDSENKKSFSLEEKSKSSKKRVHYMKFAKGKDLSCRSDTDLACIFGKREKVKKLPQDKTDSEPEEESDGKSPSPTAEMEPSNTVTSSLSVNEYFAKRMAELKKARATCTENVTETEEQCPEDNVESYSEHTKKRCKAKKHKKNDDCPEEPDVEENLQDENHMDSTVHQETRRKPKKGKKDKVPTVENSEEHEEEDNKDETLRKKKKKNKRKKERCEARQVEEVTSTPDENVNTEQPKKKKRRKRETE